MKHKKGFTLGAVIGGLCGGLTALLFAPKKGKHLRADLLKHYDVATERARELMEEAQEQSEDLIKQAHTVVADAKEKAENIVKSAKKKWK